MEDLKRKRMEKLIRECRRIESRKGELNALLERNRKLADLAELLDEEEFNLEIFRGHLKEDHYDWLHSRHKEIKQSLRGIQL